MLLQSGSQGKGYSSKNGALYEMNCKLVPDFRKELDDCRKSLLLCDGFQRIAL